LISCACTAKSQSLADEKPSFLSVVQDDTLPPIPESPNLPSKEPYVTEIALYEKLELKPDEQVNILSVRDNIILLNIFVDYVPEDPNYREEGYSSKSLQIIVFDANECTKMHVLSLLEDQFVISGVLTCRRNVPDGRVRGTASNG
jgi:hypothetical protein